jgi:hypothetical protein
MTHTQFLRNLNSYQVDNGMIWLSLNHRNAAAETAIALDVLTWEILLDMATD